ncbi:hypothetical protein HPP92_009137 [Vanilla planifolia]|uniref:GATA-type domain-containing protein n=1 Tax=Vanilla planifolia TaxID=51239 RepID=A0A835REP2_VANPL|nr:hypothetical protein HPP92_009137 [Vanilla planifolia]
MTPKELKQFSVLLKEEEQPRDHLLSFTTLPQEATLAEPHPQTKWVTSQKNIMGADQSNKNKRKRRMQSPTQYQTQLSPETGNMSTSGAVRVCSDCNTTKTPLWRSGPQGPKSLCNACGIRQMKARRAIAVASAKATSCMIVRKEKKCDVGYSVPYKKRYKFSHDGDANLQNMGFKDPLIDLNSTSAAAFHPSFPQDDKDAAILLMTLSCGVING